MTETICFMKKETVVIKAPKKPAMTSRMVVLLFAMVCGVYICSICLNQMAPNDNKTQNDIVMSKPSCHYDALQQSEHQYIHYPKPQTFTRGECACNGVRYFAILSMQRSGSGWFETLLNSHRNVSSNGEIFSVMERRVNVSAIFKTMDKLYNLDWFSTASKNHCSSAVGYKWMLNQGILENHIEIVEYFKRRGVSVIFLFRRNLLRRLISVLANSFDKDAKLLNGTHKSHVHSPFEAQVLAQYKPKINTTLMMNELKESYETSTRVVQYFNTTRHIVLYYEDVTSNRTKLEEVQEFLRLPQKELNSRQVKIHTAPLSQQVENWAEVRQALVGTSFETYINQN